MVINKTAVLIAFYLYRFVYTNLISSLKIIYKTNKPTNKSPFFNKELVRIINIKYKYSNY